MKFTYCFTTLTLLTVLSGCSVLSELSNSADDELTAQEAVAVEHSVLHKADYNIDDSQTLKAFSVLQTDVEYRSALARYSVEVPKPIDFSTQQVILATMGTQPAGGYAVGVLSAMNTADQVTVTIELRAPGPGCINTSAASNPYEFALINTTKPVVFEEVPVIQQCE